ncbi:MAG: YiiG family protein [Hyphomicrobiaceae bacterium]
MPVTRILAPLAVILVALGLPPARAAGAEPHGMTAKLAAYVACVNRLSERAHDSRRRYFSWVGKKGPTGRERIKYGLYTIYDTSDCANGVERANASEPRDEALEAAATAYVAAVTALEPLLKEANDYYTQENWKDDRMAKGKALHPRLVAAWNAFAGADETLRLALDVMQEKASEERLAALAATDGKSARYRVEAVMLTAKRLLRHLTPARPDMARIGPALAAYEAEVREAEALGAADRARGIGTSFVSAAKSYLVSAKQLMRRIRDKVPYSRGDRMILNSGGGWMVEGSPARVVRDYNGLVGSYNRGSRF